MRGLVHALRVGMVVGGLMVTLPTRVFAGTEATAPPNTAVVDNTAGTVQPVSTTATDTGPSAVVPTAPLKTGGVVHLTVSGFRAPTVNVAVCGNGGIRGSQDCAMAFSHDVVLESNAPTHDDFPLVAPPLPCPCVVRVASIDGSESASAAIDIVGHPTAALVHGGGGVGSDTGLTATIEAQPAPVGTRGRLVYELGGGTWFDVSVSVSNRSTANMTDLVVLATVGRAATNVMHDISLATPGALAPNHTWHQTVRVWVAGPDFGALRWKFVVAHNGRTVVAQVSTRHRPWLLVVVVAVFVVSLAMLLIRASMRRRARRTSYAMRPSGSEDNGSYDPFGETGEPDTV